MAKKIPILIAGFLTLFFAGCSQLNGNFGSMPTYPVPGVEAAWIREGEPIAFEGEKWYPQDDIEVLLDSEVYLMGEYKGVQFFVTKADVRPYDALYTKLGPNKFRAYQKQKKTGNDQD